MISLVQKIVMALAMLAGVVSGAFAQTPPPDPTFHNIYGVSDWKELVPERAAEYKNYRLIVLGNPTYSDDEKAAKIARKYSEIREALRANRTEAYSTISELRGVGNSATNGGGGPKSVDAKCISASMEQMYTKPEWARGVYKTSTSDHADARLFDGGTTVNATELVRDNGNQVCAIALKQSGKGRKASYSEATFRIRPERIRIFIDAEMLSMMYAISNTPI